MKKISKENAKGEKQSRKKYCKKTGCIQNLTFKGRYKSKLWIIFFRCYRFIFNKELMFDFLGRKGPIGIGRGEMHCGTQKNALLTRTTVHYILFLRGY